MYNLQIKNLNMIITLDPNLTFVKSTNGVFNSETNTLVIKNFSVLPAEEKVLYIQSLVANDIENGATILTTINATYTTGGKKESILAYSANKISSKDLGLVAAAIFGDSGFLPNTMVEWAILGLVILGFVHLGRKIYTKEQTKKELEKKTEVKKTETTMPVQNSAPENLPVGEPGHASEGVDKKL